MIPELSRALAKIQGSPYGKLTDPEGSRIRTWMYRYEMLPELPEEIKKELKIAEISYREPYRFVEIQNTYKFPNAKWFGDIADFKVLGTLLGGDLLIQAGVDDDGGKLIYTYQAGGSTHYPRAYVSSFDAFMAQNQSPIEWTKNDAKPARKPNARAAKGRRASANS